MNKGGDDAKRPASPFLRAQKRALVFTATSVGSVALVCGVFLWAIFLQYLPISTRVSNGCYVPSPPLFPEFNLGHRHCHGLLRSVRTNLTVHDECEAAARQVAANPSLVVNQRCSNPRPWVPAPFSKLVVLLVDALRFDWLVWHPEKSWWSQLGDSRALDFCDLHVAPESKACAIGKAASLPQPGHNNFAFVHHLLSDKELSHNSRLFRVIADVPTMTPQRLRGMMHGDVPPFFDISKSFAGTFSQEQDSLLMQLRRTSTHGREKKVVALGDDTWERLYGNQLTSALVDRGIRIRDIDSVDETIHQRFWKMLHMANMQNQTTLNYCDTEMETIVEARLTEVIGDWDWIVAHMLGSDHVGHTLGVHTSLLHERFAMYDKVCANIFYYLTNGTIGLPYFSQNLRLNDPDNWADPIQSFTSTYRSRRAPLPTTKGNQFHQNINENGTEPTGVRWWDDTAFFFMGDHGMHDGGQHGGGGPLEVEAGLFFWSPRELLDVELFYENSRLRSNIPSQALHKLSNPPDPIFDSNFSNNSFIRDHNYSFRSFDQVDITSTLATLGGLPSPTGNIGGIVLETIPLYNRLSSWTDYQDDGNRHIRQKRDGRANLIPVISCANKDSNVSAKVSWPLGERLWHQQTPASALQIEAADVECQKAYGSEYKSSGMVAWEKSSTAGVKLSRFAWARHLRYLVQSQHLIAWQIRTRLHEVNIQTQEIEEAWSDMSVFYSILTGDDSGSNPRCSWDQIFSQVDKLEEILKAQPDEKNARAHLQPRFKQVLECIVQAPADEDQSAIEDHIELLEDYLSKQRRFIYGAQKQLRTESNQFNSTAALFLAVLPCFVILTLLWIFLWVAPRGSKSARPPLWCWKVFLTALSAGLLYCGLASLFTSSPLLGAAGTARAALAGGLIIWITIGALCVDIIRCFREEQQTGVPRASLHGMRDKYLRGLVPNESSVSLRLLEFIINRDNSHRIYAMLPHIHWIFLIVHTIYQTSFCAAIWFPGISTRLLLQLLVTWHCIKGLLMIWRDPALVNKRSCTLKKTISSSWQLILLCMGIAILARISDELDPSYRSPRSIVNVPKTINSPQALTILISALTAFLIYGLFPVDPCFRTVERYWDKVYSLGDAKALETTIGLPHTPTEELAPRLSLTKVTNSVLRRRRSHSGSLVDNDLATQATIEKKDDVLDLQDDVDIPKFTMFHMIALGLWICQAGLTSLYFTAYSRTHQENGDVEEAALGLIYAHSSIMTLFAKRFGLDLKRLSMMSTSGALQFLLPRLIACLIVFHLAYLVSYAAFSASKTRRSLRDVPYVLMGWFFFAYLMLQDPSEAGVVCVNLFLVAGVLKLIAMAITKFTGDEALSAVILARAGTLAARYYSESTRESTVRSIHQMLHKDDSISGEGRSQSSGEGRSQSSSWNIKSQYLMTDCEVLTLVLFLGLHLSFATGHRSDFNALPVNAGFVGIEAFNPIVSVAMVIIHCTGGQIFMPFMLAHSISVRSAIQESLGQRVCFATCRLITLLMAVQIATGVYQVFVLSEDMPAWRGYAPKCLIEQITAAASLPVFLGIGLLSLTLSQEH